MTPIQIQIMITRPWTTNPFKHVTTMRKAHIRLFAEWNVYLPPSELLACFSINICGS
jgi:hypothetical protein